MTETTPTTPGASPMRRSSRDPEVVRERLERWLQSRLGIESVVEVTDGPGITHAEIRTERGDRSAYVVTVSRPDGRVATLNRGDEGERRLPLPRREIGVLLAEELRRMDPDFVYAEALSAATGVSGLHERSASRDLVWRDPAWSA